MNDITLDYSGPIWMLEILTTTDPDMMAGVEMFNFFFSQMMFFMLIGVLVKMIIRVLTRS